MAAVQDGDSSSMGVLYQRHHAALYRYFVRMSGSGPLSEDLTQEVFLRMLRKSDTWLRDARFSSWMYRIAHNAFIDQARKNRWETAMPESFEIAAPAGRRLEQDEDQALLRRALMALPAEKRELLVLSRYQGLRYEQIGELLGVETNTVKVRVFRALGQLRESAGDPTQAVANYTRALAIDPGQPAVSARVASIQSGQTAAARTAALPPPTTLPDAAAIQALQQNRGRMADLSLNGQHLTSRRPVALDLSGRQCRGRRPLRDGQAGRNLDALAQSRRERRAE